jgi:hypothetical protein
LSLNYNNQKVFSKVNMTLYKPTLPPWDCIRPHLTPLPYAIYFRIVGTFTPF